MGKRTLSWFMVLCMLITSLFGATVAAEETANPALGKIQAEFFVSPSGSDTADGSYDHPFATLQAARDAVRLINDNMTGDIYVFVAAGNYYVDETITFDERDSGTNGFDVIYRNLDGLGTAKFIGGNKITGWQPAESGDVSLDLPASVVNQVYKVQLDPNVYKFNTLYASGNRAIMARTPNKAYDARFPNSNEAYLKSADGSFAALIYKAGDLDQHAIDGLVNAQTRGDLDAQVYVWPGQSNGWAWFTDTVPIETINTNTRRLGFPYDANHPEAATTRYLIGSSARYFVHGNLALLDSPGEYYYNKTTGWLYYYPKASDGDINSQTIIAPRVQEIMKFKGADKADLSDVPNAATQVHNIVLSGLSLAYTDFSTYYSFGWKPQHIGTPPPEAEGSTDPSYAETTERPEYAIGAITLTDTNHITIENMRITNAGHYGIAMWRDNQYNIIRNSRIDHVGNGGVYLDGGYPAVGMYNNYNTVTNSLIGDVGELVGHAVGVTVLNSGYNDISHLEIYNSPRRGIWIGGGIKRGIDTNYNPVTDLAVHHNNFSYIYMHDLQQDGGDDGAFFGGLLYTGSDPTKYKPNYINQMVIDNVGANPSMTDIAPNGINLDIGAAGFELRNVKVVNPQHFNMELNTITQYGDKITLINTNVDFGGHTNQLKTFDDSLMEYEKIGITTDFPDVYRPTRDIDQKPEDIYFQDDFERGIDLSKWSYRGTQPAVTTEWMSEGVFNGKQALAIISNKAASNANPVLTREFGNNLNKIVTVKLFDRQSGNQPPYSSGTAISTNVKSLARVDDGVHAAGLGLDTAIDNKYYVILNGETETATSIRRTYGWHELKWDYTSGSDVKLYIDGVLVQTLNTLTSFNRIELGSDDGRGVSYYDQLYIYGGGAAPGPGTASVPPAPLYDSSNDNQVKLDLNFEDGVIPTFTSSSGSGTLSVIADPDDPNNLVLQDVRATGRNFYQTGANWNNYIVNLKWRFVGWGSNNVLGQAYDSFVIHVMTAAINGTSATNPASYQVIYRRNKNGTTGFPAGTPYFEISKHTSTADTSLGKAALPDGFNASVWHDFQIQTFGGKVGFVLDGVTLMSVSDSAYTYGGVAFGGTNLTYLIDDIRIVSNPTYVDYGTQFNLGNAALNGDFNPTWFLYEAAIIDSLGPVTLIRPRPILSGTSTAVMLNGVDITGMFADYTTATALPNLKGGRNTLILSEIISAGTRSYTIYLDKPYAITSTGTIDPVTTQVGVLPVLPAATNVTFADGSTQSASIQWDQVKPSQYKDTGTFTVHGRLVGLDGTVSTTVNVNGLESIGTLEDVATNAGTAPVLAETVSAVFTSGTVSLPLEFAELDPALYANAGTIMAVAKVNGYSGDVLQKVLVLQPVMNLAAGKTATASSQLAGFNAANGNDSSGTTRWNATSSAMPQWWKVDLGSMQTIGKTEIDFYDPAGRYYGYKVEVSTDGTNYTVVADQSANTTHQTTLTDTFTPVAARYVRITVTNTSQPGGFAAFYEARVFNAGSVNTDLADGKTASASSQLAGYTAANGNDSNGRTRWNATSSAMPQWWGVDLGSAQTISKTEIDFYDPAGRYYGYKVEVSTDGTNYSVVADKSANTTHQLTLTDTFTPVVARFVRITVTSTSQSGGFAAFYEARVYH
ncbi:MAG: discoidin domain-containing protein [Paenibacillaceae bacterium]|nr:discoidin domain-containing protein [Paenibacillaceae bacterium]